LKPQQPDAQSASEVHGPVINCVPVAATAAAAGEDASCTVAVAATPAAAPATVNVPCPRALAAFALGVPSPCPQPPSRVRAMIDPAQRPELNPQQPDAQSASDVQGPVMNCVPAAETRGLRKRSDRSATLAILSRLGEVFCPIMV
jgi:hypothetical protein